MLNTILQTTKKFIKKNKKEERKKKGQFFTNKEIAIFMANLYDIPKEKKSLHILEAGIGTGILSCALLEKIEKEGSINKVHLTCYEIDSSIIDILFKNLEYIKKNLKISFSFEIIKKNYILDKKLLQKYDVVIGNPPYLKLGKMASETEAMKHLCYGSPNLYFLFVAKSLSELDENGEMIYIIPRSWTSGLYFKKFRDYLLSESQIQHIHLFTSRDKVFISESILQETMILKIKKTKEHMPYVKVSSSFSSLDFSDRTEIEVPYEIIVSQDTNYIHIPVNLNELEILEKIHKLNNTLESIGLKMKTGLTVDFRNKEMFYEKSEKNKVPLFFSQHIQNGEIKFPINKEKEYISIEKKGLLQKNTNYLFVKRFTSKEEKKRLQCGIYLSKNFKNYSMISTDNKLNFISGEIIELSECLIYGLYTIFNSNTYDSYYRILNGSTQVNSTEINTIPIPNLEIIEKMGRKIMRERNLTTQICDKILEEYI